MFTYVFTTTTEHNRMYLQIKHGDDIKGTCPAVSSVPTEVLCHIHLQWNRTTGETAHLERRGFEIANLFHSWSQCSPRHIHTYRNSHSLYRFHHAHTDSGCSNLPLSNMREYCFKMCIECISDPAI